MDWLLSTASSRIPVHAQGDPTHVTGVLLMKTMIKLRPEDATPVMDLELKQPLHVSKSMLLYDLLALFQQGASDMAVVYDRDGDLFSAPEDSPALGVVTMEDVMEELIKRNSSDETGAARKIFVKDS